MTFKKELMAISIPITAVAWLAGLYFWIRLRPISKKLFFLVYGQKMTYTACFALGYGNILQTLTDTLKPKPDDSEELLKLRASAKSYVIKYLISWSVMAVTCIGTFLILLFASRT